MKLYLSSQNSKCIMLIKKMLNVFQIRTHLRLYVYLCCTVFQVCFLAAEFSPWAWLF